MSDLVLVALIAGAPAMLTVFLTVNRRSIHVLEKRLDVLEKKIDLLIKLAYPPGEND